MDLNEHSVRERAYFIWEAEGRVAGRADAHWNQALVEIAATAAPRAKAAAKVSAKAPAKSAAKATSVKATSAKKAASKSAPALH